MMRIWILIALLLASPARAVDFEGVLHRLAGPESRGRHAQTDRDDALAFLREELSRYGTAIPLEFHDEGRSAKNLALLVDGEGGDDAGWILVMAHYDHLGLGEPGDANHGQVHFGADDNASGCAVLLAVAEGLTELGPGHRGVALVFTDGEEQGLLGARVLTTGALVPLESIRAVINLDTVGRLADGGLTVFGVESCRAFGPTLDGLNTVYRFDLKKLPRPSGASDDQPFAEAGIPTLHLFTGAHETYHRPIDTVDRIDLEGLRDIADFTVELVDYLRGEDVDLSFVPAGAVQALADPRKATEGKRRVSFGSIPDFEFAGEGVKISGVLPGSPAAEAGLEKDDVIVEFAGAPVEDLTDYSEAMKRHEPGDVVEVVYLRGGERRSVTVTLVARK